ncbi:MULTISPECIES: hypothetical protein [Macrococcoides]|uniref:hypothetical protein n=1 Tax=Macrococcoides TaxID=3076173 RepID=UPI000C347BF0|nr:MULTISPECIES: hypothetical protein [Macrococcus]PKE18528.1 hypothetical protein CW679_10580 [Macrococcus caseolyticus]QNR09058.1 hypothetical protein GL258_12295 [Macrococcus canis]
MFRLIKYFIRGIDSTASVFALITVCLIYQYVHKEYNIFKFDETTIILWLISAFFCYHFFFRRKRESGLTFFPVKVISTNFMFMVIVMAGQLMIYLAVLGIIFAFSPILFWIEIVFIIENGRNKARYKNTKNLSY